ncbi:hypothetical protein V9T40_008304 [Parthenolecanium corni]|uniref:Uncharacterized protein n=1 Tax=Parthenolecanium corni TaxID=536013 RepID=A0AAN9TZS8_9HEMI
MDTDSSDDMSSAPTSAISAAAAAAGFANFEIFLRQHRAAVNAFSLNLRSSTPNNLNNNNNNNNNNDTNVNGIEICGNTNVIAASEFQKHTPPKHHTIDAILGLKTSKEANKEDRTDTESNGKLGSSSVSSVLF